MPNTHTVPARGAKRTVLWIAVVLLAAGLAVGTWWALPGLTSRAPILPLEIIGDVGEIVVLPGVEELEPRRVEVRDRTYSAITVSDVLRQAGAVEPHRLTFIGDDGHMAEIDLGGDLDSSYFALLDGGWQFVSRTYPINTWIKNIRTVIVEGSGPTVFRVISPEGDLAELTPGQLMRSDHLAVIGVEGRVAMESGGRVYEGAVLRQHRTLDLHALPGIDEGATLLAGGADGSLLNTAGGSLGVGRDHVYLYFPGSTRRVPLAGLVVDPPPARVTDLYHEAVDLMAEGRRVMAIMVDGISHIQFRIARDQGLIPNMAAGEKTLALTVFPSITPVATAAMITGKTPDRSGVSRREDRQIPVPTIFDRLRDEGKTGWFVQGSIASLALGDELVVNTDRDGDGLIDDDVLRSALELMETEPDFMFVHFKSTDDFGHTYGPYARETIDQMSVVDGFIGQLLQSWCGPVIILSDHGMHRTDDGGQHGEFRFEDMFVPYIRFEGE